MTAHPPRSLWRLLLSGRVLCWAVLRQAHPPRLHRDDIRWTDLEAQPGDQPPLPFSWLTQQIAVRQIDCHITGTTPETHAIIRSNLHHSPLYSGKIAAQGPRYCPSIEDKVTRFSQRQRASNFLRTGGSGYAIDLSQWYFHLPA